MKTTPVFAVSATALAAGLSFFALTGCNKSERANATVKADDMVADTKASMSNGWDNVKSFTFEKRDDFKANGKVMSAKWEAQMSELRANYSEAKASDSRKAAMIELKSSEAAYQEKFTALGTATADTWDSAKRNVISSWDNLQASYLKARAD
jgi:hypothetical protein